MMKKLQPDIIWIKALCRLFILNRLPGSRDIIIIGRGRDASGGVCVVCIARIWAGSAVRGRVGLHGVITEHRIVLMIIRELEGIIDRRRWRQCSIPAYLCMERGCE